MAFDGPAGGQRGGDWVAALITLMVAEIVEASCWLAWLEKTVKVLPVLASGMISSLKLAEKLPPLPGSLPLRTKRQCHQPHSLVYSRIWKEES